MMTQFAVGPLLADDPHRLVYAAQPTWDSTYVA